MWFTLSASVVMQTSFSRFTRQGPSTCPIAMIRVIALWSSSPASSSRGRCCPHQHAPLTMPILSDSISKQRTDAEGGAEGSLTSAGCRPPSSPLPPLRNSTACCSRCSMPAEVGHVAQMAPSGSSGPLDRTRLAGRRRSVTADDATGSVKPARPLT